MSLVCVPYSLCVRILVIHNIICIMCYGPMKGEKAPDDLLWNKLRMPSFLGVLLRYSCIIWSKYLRAEFCPCFFNISRFSVGCAGQEMHGKLLKKF